MQVHAQVPDVLLMHTCLLAETPQFVPLLSTRVNAAGRLYALTKVKGETDGADMPSDKHCRRRRISLTGFQGTFAQP